MVKWRVFDAVTRTAGRWTAKIHRLTPGHRGSAGEKDHRVSNQYRRDGVRKFGRSGEQPAWEGSGSANADFLFSRTRAGQPLAAGDSRARQWPKDAAGLKSFGPARAKGAGFRSRIYAFRATTLWSHAQNFSCV